jgi:transposase
MSLVERNYVGKNVFVGMDVHRNTYVIAVRCEGKLVKKWTCEANPKSVTEQLLRNFEGAIIECAYEAGFSGFSLHRHLVAHGIKNRVINAASVEVASNDRVKTDKRDAKKIAEQLEAGRLRAIYIPSLEEEERRSITRGRAQAVERCTRISNQIKMKLHYLGFSLPEHQKMSQNFIKWIKMLELKGGNQFVLDELIAAWTHAKLSVKRYDKELEKQASDDELEKIYRSAPGIGAITARTLSNELGDLSRFDNQRQLFSCTGLTPSEHSSGDKVRKGNISRQGSPRIRALLVEAAWRAIRDDKSLKAFYLNVKARRDGKRAIVAVARKMLGRLRCCLKGKEKLLWHDQIVSTKVA